MKSAARIGQWVGKNSGTSLVTLRPFDTQVTTRSRTRASCNLVVGTDGRACEAAVPTTHRTERKTSGSEENRRPAELGRRAHRTTAKHSGSPWIRPVCRIRPSLPRGQCARHGPPRAGKAAVLAPHPQSRADRQLPFSRVAPTSGKPQFLRCTLNPEPIDSCRSQGWRQRRAASRTAGTQTPCGPHFFTYTAKRAWR